MFSPFRERIAAHLPKGRIARGIITLASGTAVAQIITICSMPIVTRLYSPAQIGIISLFLSFFSFWGATLSLRYEYALLITKDDTESHVVHRLAVMLVAAMSILGLVVLWTLRHTEVLGFGLLPWWAPFAAVPILLGYGIFMVYRSWALRAGMIKAITKASIALAGANAVTRVVLGFLALGVPGLFAAQVAGSWASVLKLARGISKHFAASRPARINGGELLGVARSFMKFPVFETPSAWIDQLGLVLPLPIVATLHGATAAGWFGLARMMVGIPNSQIGGAVGDVFQMELADAVLKGDGRRGRNLFYKLMVRLALIGLFPLVGVVVLAPWLVPWIFGGNWKEAGYAAAGIAPWLYAALVVSPLSRALSVLQAQQYKLIYDICAVLLLATAFLVSKVHHYSFINSVLAISAAGVFGYLVYAVVLIMVTELYLHKPVA